MDTEVFCPPSAEARRLAAWFPQLVAPADGRGPWWARLVRAALVAPLTQLTFVSFDLQMFLFDVFHTTWVARLGHLLGMASAVLFGLAVAVHLGGLLAGALVTCGLLAWYAAIARAAGLALWWVAMIPVVGALLAGGWALSGLELAVLAGGWLASGFAISLSHAAEPLFPPRAGDPWRWMPLRDYVLGGRVPLRLLRVACYPFVGAADELWASPRLLPYNVLRILLALGYAPALRNQLDDRARRALASGNPALDYVGIGGGRFLRLGAPAALPTSGADEPTREETMELDIVGCRPDQRIPEKHTKDGSDVSPRLEWRSVPDGTECFALLCEDPDAPRGTFGHWIVFNIAKDLRELPEGLPRDAHLDNGAVQGRNDFGEIGYGGPRPPKGDEPHHYHFRLFALDKRLDLDPSAGRKLLLDAIRGHVLEEAEVTLRYSRPVTA